MSDIVERNVVVLNISYVLARYLNKFDTTLFNPALISNPQTGWRSMANETSFANWFLYNELVKNPKHSYYGSSYASKVGFS